MFIMKKINIMCIYVFILNDRVFFLIMFKLKVYWSKFVCKVVDY